MLREYTGKLVELGLSDKEAKVYLTLLQEGAITAEKAAKIAGLNRSTTYVQIKDLMEMGLVSTFKKGKKTFFAAESPTNLDRLLDTKKRNLERQIADSAVFVPELMKAYSSTGVRAIVRAFEGKPGLITMRNEMLDSGAKEIFVATNYDKFSGIFTKEELDAYSEKRAKKKIKSYVLYTRKDPEDLKSWPPQEVKRANGLQFPFGSEVYIYGHSVAFTSIEDSISGVIVSSESVANTLKGLFWLAWQAN